jgi:glucose uptake protein
MKYVFLLLPVFGWGLLPLSVSKVKHASVANQIIGTAIGSFILTGLLMLLVQPAFDWLSFWGGAVAGAAWIIGQVGQYTGYRTIGVSKTMPLSTALQLIGVPLIGVLVFHEWQTPRAKLFGALGIVLLLLGAYCNSLNGPLKHEPTKYPQVILLLCVTSLGYITCSTIPRALPGSSIVIFFGECVGMLAAAWIYSLLTKETTGWHARASWLCSGGGALYAAGSIGYVVAVQQNGINTAFVISQLAVVISTLSGFLFLGERKQKLGYVETGLGLCLLLGGAMLTTLF